MKTIITLWEPNERWRALSQDEKKSYLLGLDEAIAQLRSAGVMSLGWSKVDKSFPNAPTEGYVGVLGVDDISQIGSTLDGSQWDYYFDTKYICVELEGGASPKPSAEYARILDLEID